MGINLLTFNQATIAPKDDALIQQYALGQDGFFYGGTPTYTGGNTIHFQSGEGMMCGREFVLEDTDVSAALPASGTLLGQVYIHVDLSNVDNPIELVCETAETLTELTKDENLNVNNGTYDLQLCTFTANVSNITDLVSQIKQIKKGGGGSDENLAQIEEGTEATRAYVAGEFVVVDGLLRKVLSPIAIGDEFEDDVNEEITNVGAQITALNQNLTYRYNETTDYFQALVNGNWVNDRYAGLKGLIIYNDGTFNYDMNHIAGFVYSSLYTDYSASQPWQKNAHDIGLDLQLLHASNQNRQTTITTDSIIATSGKKVRVEYYLGSDSSNIQVLESDTIQSDAYITLSGLYYYPNTQFQADIYITSSRTSPFYPNILQVISLHKATTSAVVHVVKISVV